VLINQSENHANVESFKDFAKETLSQVRDGIGAFIAAIGTGASISGAAAIFRESIIGIQVIGFEARQSPSSFSSKSCAQFIHAGHNLIGTSPGRVASNTDLGLIDKVELIGDQEIKDGERLLEACGLSLGRTSAAGLYLARRLAKGETAPILIIFYDSGWKYPGYLKDLK
jgi:cysteine synthase A